MKRALIFGRAQGIWDEVRAAQAMASFDRTIGVGPSVLDYPGEVTDWVWFHTELFEDIGLRRVRRGFPPIQNYWSIKHGGKTRIGTANDVPIKYIDWTGGGASGLIACVIALRELQMDRVVLCGIPMTAEGGQYDSIKTWKEATKHQHAWVENKGMLLGRVRSFSGWTLQLLEGKTPTKEWLADADGDAGAKAAPAAPISPKTPPAAQARARAAPRVSRRRKAHASA